MYQHVTIDCSNTVAESVWEKMVCIILYLDVMAAWYRNLNWRSGEPQLRSRKYLSIYLSIKFMQFSVVLLDRWFILFIGYASSLICKYLSHDLSLCSLHPYITDRFFHVDTYFVYAEIVMHYITTPHTLSPFGSLQRSKTPPTSVLDMTLNNLMVRLQ